MVGYSTISGVLEGVADIEVAEVPDETDVGADADASEVPSRVESCRCLNPCPGTTALTSGTIASELTIEGTTVDPNDTGTSSVPVFNGGNSTGQRLQTRRSESQ